MWVDSIVLNAYSTCDGQNFSGDGESIQYGELLGRISHSAIRPSRPTRGTLLALSDRLARCGTSLLVFTQAIAPLSDQSNQMHLIAIRVPCHSFVPQVLPSPWCSPHHNHSGIKSVARSLFSNPSLSRNNMKHICRSQEMACCFDTSLSGKA